MAKKKIQSYIKLQIAAGMATPNPPVGPALGQHGVNIIEFCKIFNTKTANFEQGLPIPIVITVYSDRSFNFIMKTPPTAFLLKKAVGVNSNVNKLNINKITNAQIHEIAEIKAPDMTGANLEAISKSIVGTARSMGLIVED